MSVEVEKKKLGRPTKEAKDEHVHVRMTKDEKTKFLALGGSAWLRKCIAGEKLHRETEGDIVSDVNT